MSVPIHIDGYSALSERPTAFELDGVYYRIYAIEAEWRSREALFFKVRPVGKRVILRYKPERDEWSLLAAYDGQELFARAGVQMIMIDAATTRAAVKKIESCEQCNPEHAEIPFDWILDEVRAAQPGGTEYILEQPAKCPRCFREITEKTLVEPE
jgi:hypothetical protein